jgi:hypothetical protein
MKCFASRLDYGAETLHVIGLFCQHLRWSMNVVFGHVCCTQIGDVLLMWFCVPETTLYPFLLASFEILVSHIPPRLTSSRLLTHIATRFDATLRVSPQEDTCDQRAVLPHQCATQIIVSYGMTGTRRALGRQWTASYGGVSYFKRSVIRLYRTRNTTFRCRNGE